MNPLGLISFQFCFSEVIELEWIPLSLSMPCMLTVIKINVSGIWPWWGAGTWWAAAPAGWTKSCSPLWDSTPLSAGHKRNCSQFCPLSQSLCSATGGILPKSVQQSVPVTAVTHKTHSVFNSVFHRFYFNFTFHVLWQVSSVLVVSVCPGCCPLCGTVDSRVLLQVHIRCTGLPWLLTSTPPSLLCVPAPRCHAHTGRWCDNRLSSS